MRERRQQIKHPPRRRTSTSALKALTKRVHSVSVNAALPHAISSVLGRGRHTSNRAASRLAHRAPGTPRRGHRSYDPSSLSRNAGLTLADVPQVTMRLSQSERARDSYLSSQLVRYGQTDKGRTILER